MFLLLILKYDIIFLPLTPMGEEKKKQERALVHLEKDGRHYYYGNLRALCDHWPKEAIGVGHTYLKNLNITEEHPFRNKYCIIRRGIIVTSSRKKSE